MIKTRAVGNDREKRKQQLQKTVLSALFAALGFGVSAIVHFPVGGFLTLDVKDAILCIGAMFLGPISALLMSAVAALLEFLTISGTGVYGLLMNFISSAAFSFTAAIIYRYNKTFKGAILSLVSAVLSMTALMMAANLIVTPAYTGLDRSEIAAMIPKLLLPFNLIKGALNASLTALIYKPLTRALRRVLPWLGKAEERKTDRKTLVFAVVSAAVLVLSLVLLFTLLDATVEFGK